jgi:hypothetical protein
MKKLCATFIALSAALAAVVTVHAQDGAIQLLPDQIKWTALPPDVTSGATWMVRRRKQFEARNQSPNSIRPELSVHYARAHQAQRC